MEIGIEIKIGKNPVIESWEGLLELEEDFALNDIQFSTIWEYIKYTVNMTLKQLDGTLVDSGDITVYGQIEQETITKTTDSNGETTMDLLPYSTPYEVLSAHSTIQDEEDLYILIDDTVDDGDKVMDIVLYMMEGANKPIETNNISTSFSNLTWVAV